VFLPLEKVGKAPLLTPVISFGSQQTTVQGRRRDHGHVALGRRGHEHLLRLLDQQVVLAERDDRDEVVRLLQDIPHEHQVGASEPDERSQALIPYLP